MRFPPPAKAGGFQRIILMKEPEFDLRAAHRYFSHGTARSKIPVPDLLTAIQKAV